MNFELGSEQQMLRDMVDRFAADHFPLSDHAARRVPAQGFDSESWRSLAELGLLGLLLDEEMGTPQGLMVLMEAFGRGVVPEPYIAQVLMAGGLLARAGTREQKERWVGPVCAGEAHLALAFAEAEGRFDYEELSCRFDGAGLTGRKSFVFAGTATDAYIVSATNEADALGLYMVAADADGLEVFRYRLIDGSPAVELQLDGVAAEPMAGGLEALDAHFSELRIAICAELVGLMQVLFDETLNYLKIRKQFGMPIGSFQALQHRMADQYCALEQSRSMLLRATLSGGDFAPAARLAAKSYIGQAALRLGEEAIQMHGGMGVTDELIIGHAHKRVILLSSLLGDPDEEARRYLTLAA